MFRECHRLRVIWLSSRLSVGLGVTLGVLATWAAAYHSSALAQPEFDGQVSAERSLPTSGLDELIVAAEPLGRRSTARPARAKGSLPIHPAELWPRNESGQADAVSGVHSQAANGAGPSDVHAPFEAGDDGVALPWDDCDGVSTILSAEVANPWHDGGRRCRPHELGSGPAVSPEAVAVAPSAHDVAPLRWAMGALDIVDPWQGSAEPRRRWRVDPIVNPWNR